MELYISSILLFQFRKASLSTDLVDKTADETLKTQTVEPLKTEGVRSFEEIMRVKRLRKQREGQQESLSSVKPTSSSLIKRRRLLKRPLTTSAECVTTNSLISAKPGQTMADYNVARVCPLRVVPERRRTRSESIDEDALLNNSAPTTPQEESDNVFSKNTTSPAVVPRVSLSPVLDDPTPIKKRKASTSISDAEVPHRESSTSSLVESTVNKAHEVEEPSSLEEPPASREDIQEAL